MGRKRVVKHRDTASATEMPGLASAAFGVLNMVSQLIEAVGRE